MSFHHSPKIVTNGLVLCLDAGNRKSYPGSGTVFSDLSNNGYNGTLVNTPAFSASNLGFFSFNGTNNRIDLSSSFNTFGAGLGNGFTASFWLKTTTQTTSRLCGTVNTGNNLIWAISFNRGVGGRDNASIGATQFYIRTQTTGLGLIGYILTNIYDGRWHNLAWQCPAPVTTNYNIYVDGNIVPITYTDRQAPNTFANFDFPLAIGAENARGVLQNYGAFDMAQALFYNRGLNSAEVLQNYNATKGRFNL